MKAPIPEHEEELVVEFIYTTFLITNLEQDCELVKKLPFKIPEVYEELIENRLKILRRELIEIKKQMRVLKIKVEKPYYVYEDFVEYAYFAHGYEGRMRFWTAAMNFEGTRRLNKILKSPSFETK
jgi:hypothetical protein